MGLPLIFDKNFRFIHILFFFCFILPFIIEKDLFIARRKIFLALFSVKEYNAAVKK